MTAEDVKNSVRAFLRAECEPVPTKKAGSNQVHLEVWVTRQRRRAIGIEMDHDKLVNFWVTSMNIPPDLPASISVHRKQPTVRGWTDDNGDGTNSNLSAYEEFRTKPIARLGVSTEADVMTILEHLNR